MGSTEFMEKAKQLVIDYFNKEVEKTDSKKLDSNDVYVVWSCYILGNQKCLISTNISDGMYYEVTYNANKNEIYLDAYKKWKNECYTVE